MKTSIQGYNGSFHHQVAVELDLAHKLNFRNNFDDVFKDVTVGKADYGIVAIENSIAGAILENYDRLKASNLRVIGEYYLRIKMNLLGLAGQQVTDIQEVRSHPMAIKQCKEFLTLHPYIKTVEHVDTALAVEEIVDSQLQGVAGIAGEFAAEALGAQVISAGIETDPQNYTRFLVVARHDNLKIRLPKYASSGKQKTSIYVETSHQPGALLKVLQAFAKMDLNMTMLVSRPVVGEAWNYGFYIDFEADSDTFDDEKFRSQLLPLSEKLLVFGSYVGFERRPRGGAPRPIKL